MSTSIKNKDLSTNSSNIGNKNLPPVPSKSYNYGNDRYDGYDEDGNQDEDEGYYYDNNNNNYYNDKYENEEDNDVNYTYDDNNNYENYESNYDSNYDANYQDDGEFSIHQSTTNTLRKIDKKFPSFPPSPLSDDNYQEGDLNLDDNDNNNNNNNNNNNKYQHHKSSKSISSSVYPHPPPPPPPPVIKSKKSTIIRPLPPPPPPLPSLPPPQSLPHSQKFKSFAIGKFKNFTKQKNKPSSFKKSQIKTIINNNGEDENTTINNYNNNYNDNYNYNNNYNNTQLSPELPGLPELSSSPPISHQLPQEYFPEDPELDDDQQSNIYTTPELTIDDLYHLMLNMQRGFQLQVKGLNKQVKDLKKEIKKLKGEDEEEDEEKEDEEDDDEYGYEYDLNGKKRIGVMGREKKSTKKKGDDDVVTTASSVRSTTREMERYGGEGRWFHNE